MAEPISLASGLITLATFALQSSTTLFQTVQSFQNHPQRVRDLENEVRGLSGVLRTLTDTISTTTGVDLSDLELPLLQCGRACKDFQQELLRCSSRSGGNRTSFRDWAKLRYLGDNIDGFRQLLAGYKTTINIALTDANLRKSSVTAENLQSYQELIQTATDDLEARLEAIDEKLESVFARTATEEEAAELRRIKEERLSTQKCLLICAQLSEHIKEIQPELSQRQERSSDDPEALSESIMSRGLQECKASLTQTTARLEKHMLDLLDQLMTKTKSGMTQGEIADLARLQEEWTTARQCINICSKADDHLKENISIIDNHATGDDAVQFLVSTRDKTIHGKNRGHGFRIRQIGGHLSDESVQQLSQDISRISMPNSGREGIYAQEDSSFNSRNIAQKSTSRKQDAFKPGEDADSKVVKQEEVKQNSSQKRSGSGT